MLLYHFDPFRWLFTTGQCFPDLYRPAKASDPFGYVPPCLVARYPFDDVAAVEGMVVEYVLFWPQQVGATV